MAHGKPDWGLVGPKQTIYGLDDLGEAAARLDSPVIWDRRGDVILLDSFEDSTSRMQYAGALPDTIYLRAGQSRHGPLSLEIYLGGGLGGTQIDVQWYVCTTAQMVNGFEVSFSTHEFLTEIWFDLFYCDSVNEHRARLRWIAATQDLHYRDALGGYPVIDANLPLVVTADPIHVAKLVADFGADEYVRAIVDERTYALPNIPFAQNLAAGGPYIMGRVVAIGTIGQIAQIYLDRVILTQNEPV